MPSDIWHTYERALVKCSAAVRWKFVLLTFLLWIAAASVAVNAEGQGPATDFSAHTIVRPRVWHGRSKREITDTREDDLRHADDLTVGLEIDGVEKILNLRLKRDLIPVGYKQRHQHQGGYKTETPEIVELCHYQGHVRGVPDSWVAVSTCKGLKGVISVGRDYHHIHSNGDTLDSVHYVYKQSDLITNNTCGYDGTPHEVVGRIPEPRSHRTSRFKRSPDTTIRGPYNANRQSRYVELVLVIDKKEYMALGEDLDRVHRHCKDIANIINALYTPLNIFIALVGVEVWTDSDEITLSSKGDTTLSNFLNYRMEMLVKAIPNDNAQLLTRVHFEDGVVGKALKGPICTYKWSGGVSMDHSNVIGLVAATMAHEMGHNFGMEHDSADCSCPEDRCIMAPSSGSTGPIHWSSCSLEYLARAFEHGMDYCLRNKPKTLFDSPTCGNGFVEPGEQCDCGLEDNCDNSCCNATTCMLHPNASCATGECCDLTTCRPLNAGTECRSAEHECDLPEFCTGQSEYCPNDVFKIDGETCNMGKAFCHQGTCRTHNDQCKLLWGPTGSSSDIQCYHMNSNGNRHGNCGYNRVNSSYVKCTDDDTFCGMLHCKHLNERLEFGMESVAILSHSFINNGGKIIACRSAIVDLGLNQVDPGLAPDGAKCGPGKMCVNQKCMPVADLRKSVSGDNGCPNDCGGNGVCNSLGHCHCNRGFRPPDCVQPGFGGSDDSGPAEDPNARTDFMTALYILFLGVLPMMALISLGVWYAKNNPNRHWKKEALSTTNRGNSGFAIKTIDRPSHMQRGIETIDSSMTQDPACASLLPKTESDERFNNNLFGQFKGFTLTALPTTATTMTTTSKIPEPTKSAPPPPSLPTIAIKTNPKIPQRSNNSTRNKFFNSSPLTNNEDATNDGAPALPPLNAGCTARPLISSPVLAATTFTSMELISAKIPTRPAPDVPSRPTPEIGSGDSRSLPSRPNSTPLTNVVTIENEKNNSAKTSNQPEKSIGALNRLASMLRPGSGIIRSISQPQTIKDEKTTNSLPRNQHQRTNKSIDKQLLRNIEISNPIPQKEIEITARTIALGTNSDNGDKRPVVMRAQSMRDSKITAKPTIHSFGSMRQTNAMKRPTSIPASARPTSPPPVPPVVASTADNNSSNVDKIPGLPGYQNPPVKNVRNTVEDAYDDCMNLVVESSLTKIMEESPSNDNIYAVIEDPVPEKNRKKLVDTRILGPINEYKSPKPIETIANAARTSDNSGLLSEIVSEISNRNFDSIYSTSTLPRKKRDKEETDNLGSDSSINTYANSDNHYKSPGSVYSNSASGKFNYAGSTTSSGYLNPSALNVPQRVKDGTTKSNDSSIAVNEKIFTNDKLGSLTSKNPNINDAMSKALGMKPPDTTAPAKPVSTITTRQNIVVPIVAKKDDKTPAKPPLKRTKTPPNIVKTMAGGTTKVTCDVDVKSTTRQSSDTSLKSSKQNFDNASGVKQTSRQNSDASPKTSRQGSDVSLKSTSNKVTNTTKTNGNSNKSNNSDKRDSTASLTGVNASKNATVTTPVKDGTSKLNNSPDLVSSCSNVGSNDAKTSPDVTLGGNAKTVTTGKSNSIVQKTPVNSRASGKQPSMPPKPSGILTKAATFADRKKSPSSTSPTTPTTGLVKSLSLYAKDSIVKPGTTQSAKFGSKNDGRTSETIVAKTLPVQMAAGGKSNVASLQQKFETNKTNSNSTVRNVASLGKKLNVGKITDNSVVGSKK